jgi:hypothetical protein
MLSITNIEISELKPRRTESLNALVKLMETHGFPGGYDMLPKSTKHKVEFILNGTYSAFANGIRRALVEEIETKSFLIEETDILTDDEFISGTNDVLIKNMSLVPIFQSGAIIDSYDNYDVYLYVFNSTNGIIDVKVSDLSIVLKKKRGGDATKTRTKVSTKVGDVEIVDEESEEEKDEEKEEENNEEKDENASAASTLGGTPTASDRSLLDKLVPDSNIVIVRLRPGKYIKIRNIKLQSGTSAEHAGKFSLLNNVSYEPLDIEPYNQFTNKGTRSIDHDCQKFRVGFTTCGNITPKEVIDQLTTTLKARLTDIKNKIEIYAAANTDTYYSGQDCEVSLIDDVYYYKFAGHYITAIYMIAMRCFKLDENIPFCSAGVERYDSMIGIIRIIHADRNKILIKAIDGCIGDLNMLRAAFKV